MIAGTKGSASFSPCGNYRWVLRRAWDGRPSLLVVMFNPSTATADENDQTITLLCHIAAHNGYGGITVVNGIPLCSPKPAEAINMVNSWDKRSDWYERDALQQNMCEIERECGRAGAVLLAWGALADRCACWFDRVLEEIECAVADKTPLFCLGKTAGGYPKHPMARGKHKVAKDAALIPWWTHGNAPG